MTLIAPPSTAAATPAPRTVRLVALALPGALLPLCTVAAASFLADRAEIVQAVSALLAAR